MVLQLKQHILLQGENPLNARLIEKPLKAYLVANFAFNYGLEATVEQYNLSSASIYASMSFYEDNRAIIERAIEESRQIGISLNAEDSKDAIAEIKSRMKSD